MSKDNTMFPAHAGMNRLAQGEVNFASYVPRTRGDEPVLNDDYSARGRCSPHTRG